MQILISCLCAATLLTAATSASAQTTRQAVDPAVRGGDGARDGARSASALRPPRTNPADPLIESLYATMVGPLGGAALQILRGPVWPRRVLGVTDGGKTLRRFGSQLYVIHSGGGTITSLLANGGLPRIFDIGASSNPQDILHPSPEVPGSNQAFVTRRDNPQLHRLDLLTGQGVDVLDLSPVGGADPIALGTMARDGNFLFVQVRVFTTKGTSVPGADDAGVLGVVDLTNLTLVDVDPLQAGIQGIALQGAPPRLKMQILKSTRTLYVSTTEGILDNRGGIELVNLDSWQSMGYALSEHEVADLGGFVMTSPSEGYFVFHTDLLPSTHLKHFTVAGGPDPGPEMIVLLGSEEDVITYDAELERIFLPSGGSTGTPAIHVFDALTQLPVDAGPIVTSMQPYDVLIAR